MRRPAGGGYSFNVRAYLCKSLNPEPFFRLRRRDAILMDAVSA
jgi:hypothetical protein